LKLTDLASPDYSNATDDSAAPQRPKTQATLLRAVSNTAYTLAGVLYNANLAARAISFAEQACTVGVRVLDLVDGAGDGGADKEIDVLRDHMPRRWELLAVCRLKAADRQGAVEAFGKALVSSVQLLGSAQSLDNKSAQLVEQLIRVSVGELFDAEAVLLSRLFSNVPVDERLLGVMMEKAIKVLEGIMHKPVAQRAMEMAMVELMRLWGDGYPVKKARQVFDVFSFLHAN
jgi:hypothetical protein